MMNSFVEEYHFCKIFEVLLKQDASSFILILDLREWIV